MPAAKGPAPPRENQWEANISKVVSLDQGKKRERCPKKAPGKMSVFHLRRQRTAEVFSGKRFVISTSKQSWILERGRWGREFPWV